MDKVSFWKIIDSTRKEAEGDPDAHIDLLCERLQTFEPDEIVEFDRIFNEYWARAYTWDLWAAAYIIGGGCSDDGFMDFRGWLISKGEKAFEKALADPESLLRVVREDDECQYEGFQYVASQAWEQKTGKGMDDFPARRESHPATPLGTPWSESNESDELQRRFPKLFKKFS